MAVAAVSKAVAPLLWLVYTAASFSGAAAAATWCVVRSEASDEALQTALDYACFAGADCAPIQSSGLCYLPNTVQAHASYAYNSYYQRNADSAAACSFSGTATIATTDPSYGSCVYPSSPSTAGGMIAQGGMPAGTTTQGTTPATINEPPPPPGTTTTTPFYGGGGGLYPGMGPVVPYSSTLNASPRASVETIFCGLNFLLVLLFIFQIM
ncbi:hypothetical protein ABFX02_07G066900 [Erythranthe guttata]